jgi:hypothetical protein
MCVVGNSQPQQTDGVMRKLCFNRSVLCVVNAVLSCCCYALNSVS